ncbi:bifunctional glycerol-3-phosphate/glycerone-phosphate O-acyltransferase GPT2 NDAI_0H00720 [Naumovozyma dairenensis CBS 421]|uniref:Phospholipid/glycerol acyltransferase domain-containing protein n=1 Tax=Naumovozyma dairenensis (strain ATCC 10597 / BCRC 20456 / CBS 421 / NBRC 0211 / NRRL Y-12639) TaxID=1071378 RepID=G0WEN5_NAUDC|nr:hypothetical protein NDAI_0H00720 [Naumovozyma dairenensis CBS 421]CCD26246.1 hypothetical protein NDAI_0H00720 [Naumovozyma dairenensis CBS 421]
MTMKEKPVETIDVNPKPKSRAHIPKISRQYKNDYTGLTYNLKSFTYDIVVFLFNILFTIFFREIKVRGGYNIPPNGTPTILVCAPHANQFIDPSLVMTTTRKLAATHGSSRGRQACFVTAASSLKLKLVGFFGRCMGSVPVERAQDNLKPVSSNIEIYAPDLINNSTLIKGRCRTGENISPQFTKRFNAKGLLGLPNYLSNAQIAKVVDDETIILSSPFKSSNPKVREYLEEGTTFKYAKPIDNTQVFQNVFDHLHTKGCVGIFPEGGSHDRPSLLPIKAGVAIMALGAVAADPSMTVSVVPVGLHYFHRDKFRSRAVLEYGEPILVNGEMGKQYALNSRETVSKLLTKITDALFSVTENAPDFDTLMTIQAARRLYQRSKLTLSLPVIVEINRRLLVGYSKFKDDERIINLKKMVHEYNDKLFAMGLKDHQVMSLHTGPLETIRCLFYIVSRVARLSVFFALSLPGSILFTPIFVGCSIYSKKKAREGLKKSLVKIKGTDLLATWKLIVALIMAPILYVTYSLMLVSIASKNEISIWVPSSSPIIQFFYFYAILVFISYSSLKTGEIGMDLFKSLRPLFITLFYPKQKIEEIQTTRKKLSLEITTICNELGPHVFKDFDQFATTNKLTDESDSKLTVRGRHQEQTPDFLKIQHDSIRGRSSDRDVGSSRSSSVGSVVSRISSALSRVNSRGSLSNVPILSEGRSNYRYVYDSSSSDSDNEDATGNSKITSLIREKWEASHAKGE